MVKYILIAFMAVGLASCMDQPVKTVYRDKNIPIYVVPKAPAVNPPVLVVNTLTDAQKNDPGELSKAYAISLKQAMQYACQLKSIVDTYAELAQNVPTPIMPVFPLTTAIASDTCKKP
jgi:hypothetical protein